MDDPHLKYAVEGTTALITLNRPEVKNAFSLEMLTLWRQALEQARDNDRVRVIILTGQGDAFCAGGDLQEMDQGKFRGWDMKRFLWETVYPVAFIMESLDKPVIAAVNGAAAGAGLDMALMCDFRICSNRAKFSASFINIGLLAGDGGAYFLPRLIGLPQALEMLLTGDLVSAEEAYRIGLVNRVVPQGTPDGGDPRAGRKTGLQAPSGGPDDETIGLSGTEQQPSRPSGFRLLPTGPLDPDP